MDGAAEYMEYLMARLSYARLSLDLHPARRTEAFEVRGLGIREGMRPGMVNRRGGTRDYLFMQFHTEVLLGVDGQVARCGRNTFMLWEPDVPHYYGNPDRRWAHSWLHCDGASVEAALGSADIPLNRPMLLPDTALADEALTLLYAELSENKRPDRAITESLVQIWIRKLRRAGPAGKIPTVPPRILAAQAYLDRNSSEGVSLEDLAGFVGLSASHLSAEFSKHLGTPPMRYLLELRLTRAAYLLANANLSIAEVAREAGFRDPLYFSRQFKKRFGLSPRPYRRGLLRCPPQVRAQRTK
jgi:AraC family transcriptional regulator, arabinose operon regulatory protein